MPKDGGHGGFERGAKVELVEAEKASRRVEDAVVGVHGRHEPACERVPREEGYGGHGVAAAGLVRRWPCIGGEGARADTYVNKRFHSAYRLSAQNPAVVVAWSRSRPLEKNLGMPEVMQMAPMGWEHSRMSRAWRKVWQKVVVSRLSGGEEKVRR